MGWEIQQAPGQAAYKKWERYLSRLWSETRKTCNRSSCLSEKSSPESVACTQTVRQCQKTGTAYNSAVQNCISDISRRDRIQPQGPRHNSSSAPVLLFPPSSACVDQGDPSHLEVRLAGACDLYLFFRVFLVFRHHDSRGDRTCDPQTPPSVSRTGL
jgi:hypothetical protein